MGMRISVWDSKELQATVLAIRAANRELRGNIRRFTREEIANDWSHDLAEQATTHIEHRVLVDSARVTVSNQNVTLKSGGVGGRLGGKGSAKPADIVSAVEFGADQGHVATYASRRRKGKAFEVKNRHTHHQFKAPNRKGYVVYPAAAREIPRYASLWVQTCIRTIMDAVDGGTK
ncbi:hypothetical protein GCM10027414_07160 [Humibacter ginsengiterrae]